MAGQEPTAAQRAETILAALKRTMDRYRWCWDCGTTESQCKGRARSVGAPQKCCPDCRHRGWPEQLDVAPEADAEADAEIRRMRGN
jgi:hypothetical protein